MMHIVIVHPVSIVTDDITLCSPQVLSKGKVVHFGSHKFVSSADNKQILSFQVTPAMVPSIRLLVYYILYGEGTSELVADSIWLDVKHKCVSGLQVRQDSAVVHCVCGLGGQVLSGLCITHVTQHSPARLVNLLSGCSSGFVLQVKGRWQHFKLQTVQRSANFNDSVILPLAPPSGQTLRR